MEAYSLLYRTNKQLKRFLESNHFVPSKRYLIKIHTAVLTREEILPILRYLKENLPNSSIIGCSVSGIIFKGKMLEGETLITFLDMESSHVAVCAVPLSIAPASAAREVVRELNGIDDSFLFVFYPPKYSTPSRFIDELQGNLKNCKIMGGGAYSSTNDEQRNPAYTICDLAVSENHMVVAKLYGINLWITEFAAMGIEAIGKSYKITRIHENTVLEVDHMPAKKWYNYLVGDDFLKKDFRLCDAFPLIRKRKEDLGLGINIVYNVNPMTGEDLKDGFFVFDALEEGEEIKAGYINPKKSAEEVRLLCEKINSSPAEAIFAYSCMTRRHILQNCASWELSPFAATQVTGAFLAGELIYNGTTNEYANSAFCVAALSENPVAKVNLDMSRMRDTSGIQFDNIHLINYFLSTANSELKQEMTETTNRLTQSLTTDEATGLPNLSKFVFDTEKKLMDKACLISLRNENIIRVFTNRKNFADYIKTAAKGYQSLVDTNVYRIYIYNELSIIIAASKQVTGAQFLATIEKLKAYLYAQKYGHYLPIFEFSIAFSEEDLLRKLELSRLKLEKKTEDTFIYNEDEYAKSEFNAEARILQILNEAITNGGVMPVYQGIRDNKLGKIEMYEALMRIKDSTGRIYSPGEFLDTAKEYKLYNKLSLMMIEKVFDEFDRREETVTVNLNIQDIYNYDMLKLIFDRLALSARPEKYVFEIVESESITDYDYLKEFTNRIHSLGAKIAIDDFGAGYSNLLHLLKVDADYIKITGEIVKDICKDSSCQEFVKIIANWCNSRNKYVVAEYVKDEQIQEKVMEYSVSHSQGYLFSKPSELI